MRRGLGYSDALFRRIGHPVTWIGAALAALDARLNRDDLPEPSRRARGFAALAALLVVTLAVAAAVQAVAFALPRALASPRHQPGSPQPASRSAAWTRMSAPSLRLSKRRAWRPAASAVGKIVGRDTAALDEAGVARAAIESLAENFADGVVAPAFWLALAGLPGGLGYKAVNTADSMIGHLTPRHASFGFAAAKLDDLLNWPAARLAALWLVAAAALVPGASAGEAWRITRRDARGPRLAERRLAGGGDGRRAWALAGRPAGSTRGGRSRMATIGDGTRSADAGAIRHALKLYRVACGLEIAIVGAGGAVLCLIGATAGARDAFPSQ